MPLAYQACHESPAVTIPPAVNILPGCVKFHIVKFLLCNILAEHSNLRHVATQVRDCYLPNMAYWETDDDRVETPIRAGMA